MKRILVVAGSDSSGGAGLEADQKVIAAHGCYAMTATTALTAQNTQGVFGIHETPPEFVKQQIDACVEDIGVDVLKTGMLASAETARVVAAAIANHHIPCSVVDPVMVSTSGAQLLPEPAIKVLSDLLLPIITVLTPNIPEANLLLKKNERPEIPIEGIDDLKRLALSVRELGPKWVLLKGGHAPLTSNYEIAKSETVRSVVIDVLYGPHTVDLIESPYRQSRNTHGTGCSLASAIACNLAQGMSVKAAVTAGCRYINAGILNSFDLGKGSGPINHFHSLHILPFSPGGFIDYVLQRDDVTPAWKEFTHHDFVRQMGDGSLPVENFKYYMIQDYLYLIQFARANALAGYKAKNMDDIAGAAAIVTHIHREMNLHIAECKEFGLTVEMMEKYEESQACTAYSRYVLDVGQSEDWIALQISLLPCLLGYSVIARRLHGLQTTDPPNIANRYLTWINNYVAEDYSQAVERGCALIEKYAVKQSPSRIEELVKIFVHATKMETGFWAMASEGEGSDDPQIEFSRDVN